MAKVNAERASDYIKGRMEQRFIFWMKKSKENVDDIKKELLGIKFWQLKRKRECKNKLLAAYLTIETLKQVIIEVRLLQ